MFRLGARLSALAVAAITTFSLGLPAAAQAARPLTRAFADDVWFDAGWQPWVHRTVVSGAKVVLLEVDWAAVEPRAPAAGADPTDPSGSQFNFGFIDQVMREFAGSGIAPAFLVSDAPRWAEAPGGPAQYEADGAWRPDPTAYGQLGAALARRYSGAYPDPIQPGRALARVRYFQAWGEANFNIHLSPQWTSSGGQLVSSGPEIYRGLLNAFYAGVKGVRSDDVVITTGFGPFGDPPGGRRTAPALFLRNLLCLQGQRLSPVSCPSPAHFDAVAIDPYEFAAPTQRALNVDDVSAPDLGKLTRIVNKAVRLGRAVPRGHKGLWVTEFSYDSNPPNPSAISTATQARWLQQALYLFWKQGVSTAVWYLLRDQPGTNFNASYFSGIYFFNGTPKPSAQAYRFPLVVMPSGRRATVWGISPRSGSVAVQRRVGRSWRTLFHLKAGAGGVFTRNISGGLKGKFRAVVGGESSLTWRR